MGLVAFAAVYGVAAVRADASADATNPVVAAPLSFDIVQSALAAGLTAPELRSATFELHPDPNSRADPVIARRVARYEPTPPPEPLPTPVAPPPPPPDPKPVVALPPPPPIVGNGMLVWPVKNGTITQYFHTGHLALDIAAPAGTTVHAGDAGVVTWAGWRNNGGGNVIEIDHGNGIVTVYNHLSSIGVTVGQTVARDEGIGAVGCTGNCTGPHVHFEVIVNGVLVNPLRYL
jgi:murein DD-endopeptidase MepM/ murein hydrolase activator NlpD